MRVCQSIQEPLDEELSQMWEGLDNCEEDVRSERSDWCAECEAELN